MFEKASRLKLRFQSSKGNLSTEDLWDLNLQQLNTVAKSLNKKLKESEEDDFLEEKSEEDTITKLKFDIVLSVLETKKNENKLHREESKKRVEKQKILEILAKKQDESLENMSEEDLKKELEKYN